MPPRIIIFVAVQLAACAYALWRGGEPERWMAGMMALGTAATAAVPHDPATSFVQPGGAIIPFDTFNLFYRPGAAGASVLAEARQGAAIMEAMA